MNDPQENKIVNLGGVAYKVMYQIPYVPTDPNDPNSPLTLGEPIEVLIRVDLFENGGYLSKLLL